MCLSFCSIAHGLLGLQEKTDLEEQRQALAKEVQNYRSKILQLEEDLLYRLSNSTVSLSLAPIL